MTRVDKPVRIGGEDVFPDEELVVSLGSNYKRVKEMKEVDYAECTALLIFGMGLGAIITCVFIAIF